MKYTVLFLFLIYSATGKAQQEKMFAAFGIDYRTDPIDIEDLPRGPLPTSTFGYLTGINFWKTFSIHGRLGMKTKSNWLFSVVCYTRYNQNHYLEDPYRPSAPTVTTFDENTKNKKKIKFDVFFDIEKKIKIAKNREKYFTLLAGIGLININSQADLTYRSNITSQLIRYKGTYLHFGPKLSLGYQYKRFKGSLDAYVIEDPSLLNLSSLWLGSTISYEINIKQKKR